MQINIKSHINEPIYICEKGDVVTMYNLQGEDTGTRASGTMSAIVPCAEDERVWVIIVDPEEAWIHDGYQKGYNQFSGMLLKEE